MAEIRLQPLLQPLGPFLVPAGQIENGVHVFAQKIIESRDNDLGQIFLKVAHVEGGHGADQRIDEQQRLHDLDVEQAVGAQADEAQFIILEGHRFAGAPFEAGENLGVDEIGLGPQGAFKTPRQSHDLVQNGNIGRFEGVPACVENMDGLAVVEEHAGL